MRDSCPEKNAESAGSASLGGVPDCARRRLVAGAQGLRLRLRPRFIRGSPAMEIGGTPAGGAQNPALRARWSLFRPVRMRRFLRRKTGFFPGKGEMYTNGRAREGIMVAAARRVSDEI